MKRNFPFSIFHFPFSKSVNPLRRRREGFTLLEIMLAVAIFGVISITVAMVFHGSLVMWKAGTHIADEGRNADAVLEQIAMALRSSYYPETRSPTYEYGFQHEGNGSTPRAADSISWVKIGNSLIGEDVPWAGVAHRVVLYMEKGSGNDGPGLYVKAWQFAGQSEDFDPEQDVKPLLISDQIISFKVEMRDPDYVEKAGQPYDWLEEWGLSNRIPTHVLVTIAVNAPNEKDPPIEYTRMVDIPMADLSWNPIQTAGGGRGGRGGGGGGGGGGGSGGAVVRPGGTFVPGGGGGGNRQPGGGAVQPGRQQSGDNQRQPNTRPGRQQQTVENDRDPRRQR